MRAEEGNFEMDTSKVAVGAAKVAGKMASIFGYLIGGFFLICFIVVLADPGSATPGSQAMLAVIFAAFTAAGVLLAAYGWRTKRRLRRFKQYVNLISVEHIFAITQLATASSQSVDFVIRDLQKMIDSRFFANAQIDRGNDLIVIGQPQPEAADPVRVQVKTAEAEMETVTCPGCGAANSRPKGTKGTCDYCGTQLQ